LCIIFRLKCDHKSLNYIGHQAITFFLLNHQIPCVLFSPILHDIIKCMWLNPTLQILIKEIQDVNFMKFLWYMIYLELETSYKYPMNILHMTFVFVRLQWIWVEFAMFSNCSKNHNPILITYVPLIGECRVFPECLSLYRAACDRQYSLPIMGPPIIGKLPIFFNQG
jgi:hypothetical protein